LFDVDLAIEKEQDKGDSEQWSQERLDNPEQEASEVERLRLGGCCERLNQSLRIL
jgi:hypothetical protein